MADSVGVSLFQLSPCLGPLPILIGSLFLNRYRFAAVGGGGRVGVNRVVG